MSNARLAALESALKVAITSGSQLPELLFTSRLDADNSATPVPLTDDDNKSSVYEVPVLLSNEPEIRFLTDSSEGEKTTEEVSNVGCPTLYESIPTVSESCTEAGDESGFRVQSQRQQGLMPSASCGPETNYSLNYLAGPGPF